MHSKNAGQSLARSSFETFLPTGQSSGGSGGSAGRGRLTESEQTEQNHERSSLNGCCNNHLAAAVVDLQDEAEFWIQSRWTIALPVPRLEQRVGLLSCSRFQSDFALYIIRIHPPFLEHMEKKVGPLPLSMKSANSFSISGL